MGTKPRPATMDELREQCAVAQVGALFADGLTKVMLADTDEDTVVIRLPRKSVLEATSQRLEAATGATYPLPEFYRAAFGKDPVIESAGAFRDARIGEYTISECM